MKPTNKMMNLIPVLGRLRKYYDFVYDYQFNDEMNHQSKRLERIKDIYDGKCFIIGNGPSINKTNLDLLKGHMCFGVNKFFLNDFSKYCKFWAVQDSRVFRDYHKEILGLDKVVFLGGSRLVDWCKKKSYYWDFIDNTVYVPRRLGTMFLDKRMSTDASNGIYMGIGVTFLCLQMAYHLGFKEVYVLGMDCDHSGDRHFYNPDKNESNLIKKTDWSREFLCYNICRREFEKNGRTLSNATVGGKLEVLPRVKLEDVV